MPVTLGPIRMAAFPGTGSYWLSEVLRVPAKDGGLGFGWYPKAYDFSPLTSNGRFRSLGAGVKLRQKVEKGTGKAPEQVQQDRHAPGPCTCTIVRNVPDLLRSWFLRFRHEYDTDYALKPVMFQSYISEVNAKIDYWGPDFKVWLDSYLANAAGELTRIYEMFTSQAKYTFRTETLRDDLCAMLRAEGMEGAELVQAFPRKNESRLKKPDWPPGYPARLLASG